MIDKDLKDLLQKAEELQKLFVLGQRVIPFLEEIVIFVSETKPLLDEINISIEENIQKMPKASSQISKVTEATENAATEIMDTLDGMTFKTGKMSANLQRMREIALLADRRNEYGLSDIIDNCDELLLSVKDDSNNIMMALQVQDITSQQLAAVNHLLETIQLKLGRILNRFGSSGMNDLILKTRPDESNSNDVQNSVAYDPDAIDVLRNGANRQNEIDELVSAHTQATASQEEIDSFFKTALAGENDASQNEIDSLFQK